MDTRTRCTWLGDDPLMRRYHDEEWGVPVHEDRKWLELIVLGGFQAGLSWRTVLRKRGAFREVFHGFDPHRVAALSEAEVDAACRNQAIIRNRAKIRAAVNNARCLLAVQAELGSFDDFIWGFTEGHPIHNAWQALAELPARSGLSDRVSRALKERGFSFAGSTICYAFLQAGGVVNDHIVSCYRHAELRAADVRG